MQSVQGGAVSAEFAALTAALDSYLSAVRDGLLVRASDADLLAEVRGFESLRRRLGGFDLDVLPEVDRRGLPGVLGARHLADLLQGMLRVSAPVAKRRVEAVAALGPHIAVSGQLLGPQLPVAADAVRAGSISAEHVASIVKTLDELPSTLPPEQFAKAERILVTAATRITPKELTGVGLQLIDTIDPDGAQPSEQEQRRHRSLAVQERRDGGVEGRFRLSAGAGAKLLAVLQPLAAPRPAEDGCRDDRSHGQRLADALEDLCELGLRADELTPGGGPAATLIVTMTSEQYEAHKGLARTGYGQRLPVATALQLAAEAHLSTIVHAATGAVLSCGDARRFATPPQTRALFARDRGCSFPGCRIPPQWCQRHHVVPWWLGGPTDLKNLTLVCGYHHREFEKRGWRCVMPDGMPWWIPPPWIDPEQTPQQNHRILLGI
jgi:hypothetical protein